MQLKVAKKLTSFIKEYCKLTNPRVLEIGCGTGLLSRELVASINPPELILNDLCPDMEAVHSRSTLPDTHYLRTHIWTWTNLHGHVCRHTRADLFETVIQIVDRDPAEGALLLAEEYSRSLKGKVELLQGFLHSAKDLV